MQPAFCALPLGGKEGNWYRMSSRGLRLRFPLIPLYSFLGVFLAAGMLAPASALAGGEKPQLVLRVYTQNEDPAARSMPLVLTDPEQTIHINADPEVSEHDLIGVEPYLGPNGETGAILRFSHHAGMVLNAASLEKMGKILVVSLNGRIVYSPVIDTALNETLVLPRGVNAQDMALLQAMIKENLKRGGPDQLK